MNKIAIVGAGTMGSDLALDLALNGKKVVLKDIAQSQLQEAKDRIAKSFRSVLFFKKNIQVRDLETVLNNIVFTTSYDGFSDQELIVENISENWELKKKVYHELGDVCNAEAVFAINTSCISITEVASELPNQQNVVGMHFMNPVPLKELVEVVRGFHTSDSTIERSAAFLKTINKQAVVVNDYPGFVANRLSHLFMNEAAFLVQDNVAAASEIDLIFKKGYGHAMGPLETADLIGLDTVVDSLNVLYNSYQDSKFRCCPLLKKMVAAGLLGRKSGQGFYKY